jgi:hypothetical protein
MSEAIEIYVDRAVRKDPLRHGSSKPALLMRQRSARSAFALLLALHRTFSTWCSLSARKYSPKHFQWKFAKPPHKWHLTQFSLG